MTTVASTSSAKGLHRLRILIVFILVVLTVQGWFGDTVNIFFIPATGGSEVAFSLNAILQAIYGVGFPLVWHAFEGLFLVILSVVLLGLSFAWAKKRSVRICSILATIMVFSAALGGLLFVLSGFNNGGNSAQMGGSFIGAYAFYFMELYFTK